MSTANDVLATQISTKLRVISANDLQVMAEDMAAIACPHMFKGLPLQRQGRGATGQTNKGWPDAYVVTSSRTVHGIEATRNQQTWTGHLADDLKKALDTKNFGLSGYFFVAGSPEHDPPEKDIQDWTDKFIALGIDARNVHLLVGKHLALELVDPKYARILQLHLGLPSASIHFEEIRQSVLRRSSDGLGSPGEDDLIRGLAFKPGVADAVATTLVTRGACIVRGSRASGKTTLAHWLGLAPAFTMSPVYKFDVATWGDDGSLGSVCNEMTVLAGTDVLFIIDNIHLDEGAARVLADHWRHYCKPSDARLLMLGRSAGANGDLPGLPPALQIRAGTAEMAGIVRYVTAKIGHPVAAVPQDALKQWAHTFDGRIGKGARGVDLIAFSAAAKTRAASLAKGQWQLEEGDAIAAVQSQYLRPIREIEVRRNLLRLAVLSDLEFPIPARVLPFPEAGFSQDCIDRGLVVTKGDAFSLPHAALGRLLCVAADTDVSAERLAAVAGSAVLTARMLARGVYPNEHDALLQQLRLSLADGNWLVSCRRLSDVASVLSVAVRLELVEAAQIDRVTANDPRLIRLVQRARNLETFTSVAGTLRARDLPLSANRLLDFTDQAIRKALDNNLMQATDGQALAFLKNLANPGVACAAIDLRRWSQSRQAVALDRASQTSQLVRHLEKIGQSQLAAAPSREFVLRFDEPSPRGADLGDISNIVRHAHVDEADLRAFFNRLASSGWLSKAYVGTSLGQLCGALMSFANHLSDDVRPLLRLPAIEARIVGEMARSEAGNVPAIARFICLLGGASALWKTGLPDLNWTWPVGLSIREVYDSRAPVNATTLGMYELQFWLGLRWLWINGVALPLLGFTSAAADFMGRLKGTEPPSQRANALRKDLVAWLETRQAEDDS
ncbi:hypothetical protein [Variovorax boronicumulans]|uniref:hypothetical protein n=1 Tax=Variovorax boronicumulans TaxID=436515 RepID=UPI001C5A221D